jgi:RND family efflux transporter MFP subunit
MSQSLRSRKIVEKCCNARPALGERAGVRGIRSFPSRGLNRALNRTLNRKRPNTINFAMTCAMKDPNSAVLGQALGTLSTFTGRAMRALRAGLSLLPLMLLVACGKHAAHAPAGASLPQATVRVQPAQSQQRTLTEEVVGTVRAKLRATLEAKVSGRIELMPVALGQRVKTGELIARLDAAEVKARLEQAQASLEQTQRDWNRISSLFKGQAVTRSEADTAESRLRLAKASVAEAEAMIRYAEVLAPFDGVISRKWVEVGDLASPGKPLVELENASALQLEADIPEGLSARLEPGATLAVRLDNAGAEITGKLSEIAPSADPASRTVKVKVDLAPAPGLIPGRFARLLVPMGESAGLYVPAPALVERGQLEMVFVVTNQHARLQLVKAGKRFGERVEILSGLDGGESVVVEGASLLADGQPVEVK